MFIGLYVVLMLRCVFKPRANLRLMQQTGRPAAREGAAGRMNFMISGNHLQLCSIDKSLPIANSSCEPFLILNEALKPVRACFFYLII